MPVSFVVGGWSVSTDQLTVGDVERIEQISGHAFSRMDVLGSAADCTALLTVLLAHHMTEASALAVVLALPFSEIIDGATITPDDRPETYEDGMPIGGRPGDSWKVVAAKRFGWLPDDVNRQKIRDLEVIFGSCE